MWSDGAKEKKKAGLGAIHIFSIPGEHWSPAWDDHAKYLAVKLCANLTQVRIVPKRDASLKVTCIKRFVF